MMNPCRSCSDEDVYQVGDGVEAVEEEVEELRPGPLHHVIFHHKGVEGNPVDQRDEQRHGGGHALQGPGYSATLSFRENILESGWLTCRQRVKSHCMLALWLREY